jgi:BirA family biotin operon repressor/biotin-[acetyl-CoA-carboxylase] ligase
VLEAAPDRLGSVELAPHLRGAWRRIVWYAEVDSTQRIARELARDGAEEGTCVIAEAQTAGRGRLGRTWHSPAGLNLYTSIVLRPVAEPTAVPQLALVAGIAVAAAIRAETQLPAQLKWPNDVLIDGRKVAGILTEMEAEVERVHFVIAGIGVNVNAPARAFSPELRATATSLAIAGGRRVDRAAVTARLLVELEERVARFASGGFAALRAEWEALSCLTGRPVTVTAADGQTPGQILGIADDGALRLATASGEARIVAGEVTLRSP